MREYPLTKKQIEICDFLLSINQQEVKKETLEAKEYVSKDLIIVEHFLKNNNFIYSANPVVLTEKGAKYSKNGIFKYFKDQRRDEFFNSIVIKTIAVWVGIFMSLAFGITNYIQNRQNKHDNAIYIKHSEIDSILNKKFLENTDSPKDKFTIEKVEKDSINHIE